ncbi:MAG TPA: ester cyclase [Pseudonocardiaceae bacterium]|jgi:predicted ester cyclase/iron-sulfur cluster repair protein YtfE (RIC family)|nr:ester cyclase [Pseudonocardiaceae bacterium]
MIETTTAADLPTRVVRHAFTTFETGDVTDVDSFCHADYRNHEAPDHAGPPGFRTIVAAMRGAFSDLFFEEQHIISQGDTVALWTVMRGRHTGEFHGLRATGRVIEQRQTHWVRVRDGKLAEHHAVRDDLGLLVQLGVIPIPGGPAGAAATGMPSCALFDAAVRGAVTASTTEGADTRDMIVVHTALRREFRLAPGLVRGTPAGDVPRASTVAGHLELMNGFLRLHHAGEDRLLWPKLIDRAPTELAGIVTLMRRQHEQIHELIASAQALVPRWRSTADAAQRDELADALEQLNVVLDEHLGAEEQHILPLAARWLSASEWHQLGEQAMAELPRNTLPLLFGMFMYEGDPEVISSMLAHAPLLPRLLMPVLGPRAYARYARRLHRTVTP